MSENPRPVTQETVDYFKNLHASLAAIHERHVRDAERAQREADEIGIEWDNADNPSEDLDYRYTRAMVWQEHAAKKRAEMTEQWLAAHNEAARAEAELNGWPTPNPI